tara:strand:- start:542 stop:1306 length:765 start_codon:yes stop_codon:yes gene_type:complete
MDLVKFVTERRYESITDNYQMRMVVDCIQFLKEVYEDESGDWVHKAIHDFNNREDYQFEDMLEFVNASATAVSQDLSERFNSDNYKKLRRYRDRKLFQFRKNEIIEIDFYIHALFHILDYFVNQTKKTERDWIMTVRMYENLHTIRLIYWFNVINTVEKNRTKDQTSTDDKNRLFDERPLNVIRIEVVQRHAKELLDLESLTLDECIKKIKKRVLNELDQLSLAKKLPEDDLISDYGKITKQMYQRWISKILEK